jgi:hypothetical protein
VGPILIERHRLGCTRFDFRTSPLDLRIPRFSSISIGILVEAANELEGELGALFRRKLKYLGENGSRSHGQILADHYLSVRHGFSGLGRGLGLRVRVELLREQ